MVNKEIFEYITKFIIKEDLTNYLVIIAYGSFISGRCTDLSNLDIMIIKKNYETQDCGSTIIDAVRVEFFIQDIKKLYQLVRDEIKNNLCLLN